MRSCDEFRRALPLPDDPGPDADALRTHALTCSACAGILSAYEADAQALRALREGPRDLPPAMEGFADAVLGAVAAERAERKAREPGGVVLRPVFGPAWLAAAAVLLLGFGLAYVLGSARSEPAPRLAGPRPDPQGLGEERRPVVDRPLGEDSAPLPAPRRVRHRAPAPLRRPGIVPVDGGRPGTRLPLPLESMLRDVQRAFPNWSPSGLDRRVPPLRPGEREVRF
ncbi:MAG: hypothetical protein D6731_03325 [Planctomycetota bacterium]|nr:MAG: hypothetical protein D6731_03325 [Planctomycetota bacterium]